MKGDTSIIIIFIVGMLLITGVELYMDIKQGKFEQPQSQEVS